jgi:NADP-dependent aldehyde dehydrogenase
VVARAHGATGEGLVSEAHVFETAAVDFLADPSLAHEVFGATALLVRCADRDELLNVIRSLDGQLTASIHANEADLDLTGAVLPVLEPLVGRVIFNGFGTGVEVCDAMVHGGPYPATSDGRSTSVGSLAIQRFVRPVCYQDLPTELLPAAVRDDNPWNLPRRVDGVRV